MKPKKKGATKKWGTKITKKNEAETSNRKRPNGNGQQNGRRKMAVGKRLRENGRNKMAGRKRTTKQPTENGRRGAPDSIRPEENRRKKSWRRRTGRR